MSGLRPDDDRLTIETCCL